MENVQVETTTRNYRPLEELNLLDDFLMNSMASSQEFGEEFCRELISIIMGVELTFFKVVTQKVYYGSMPGLHGARLDVYIDEDGNAADTGTVYDIEPENGEQKKDNLPKRTRFYHSKLDVKGLKAGDDYEKLKRVFVIMIMPFDPFGLNRMVYTIQRMCKEVPDMPYDDGSKTIFLYTKGQEGAPSTELRELMKYMEETNIQNAANEKLRKIQAMVDRIKSNEEVSIEYMKAIERERMIKEEAAEYGQKIGEEIGKEIGKKIGAKRINQLTKLLADAGRMDDIVRAASDREYQEKLLQEFDL